jgi:uncharacterized protein (DUF362 family)
MKSIVSLVKLESPEPTAKDISKAIQLIQFKQEESIKSVVIKPNLCYYCNASTGQTTDPALVGALVDYLRETYGQNIEIKIAEADASAMQTKYAFRLLGYTRLAQQKQVKLLNLSEDTIKETEVQVNGEKITLKVPQTLLKSDLFINVPKLKVMRQVHITCAMKNLFGAIAAPRKVVYHKILDETIVGINKLLKPHLTIVDGITAFGKYPVKLNLLMAGTSTFEVDWVAAQVMGYQPSKIRFLNLAIKEHLGEPRNIDIIGEKPEVFSKDFPTENNMVARLKMVAQTSLIKVYSKVSGDIVPPVLDDK